jgi:hypothetical protein
MLNYVPCSRNAQFEISWQEPKTLPGILLDLAGKFRVLPCGQMGDRKVNWLQALKGIGIIFLEQLIIEWTASETC